MVVQNSENRATFFSWEPAFRQFSFDPVPMRDGMLHNQLFCRCLLSNFLQCEKVHEYIYISYLYMCMKD